MHNNKNDLNILIACEFSGRVRDAFRALGYPAVSADFLRSETPGPHYQGNVSDLLSTHSWDLLIAFPPCTHLASSGARWFHKKPRLQADALSFVRELLSADIPHIALENPVGVISTHIRKPDQIIQPWQFGDPYSKTTCLWLKNLPKLEPTTIVGSGEKHVFRSGNSMPSWYDLPPGPGRSKTRSRTFPGIAAAMASLWGSIL